MPSLDPLLIAQLGSLELKARRLLEGFFSGHYIRRIRGASQEFSEHRSYNVGDDLKRLDWKIWGRTDRLMIKSFHEETNVAGTILMDTSASMAFSDERRMCKLDYARILAAALGYLMVSQNDGVGLTSSQATLPVGRGQAFLKTLFEKLDQLKAQGDQPLSSMVHQSVSSLRRKQILLIFSDLMQDVDSLVSSLSALESKKHEILVFQILDPSELDFPFEGPVIFEDMESHQFIKTDPDVIREGYRRIVHDRLHSLRQVFRKANIEYEFFTTDMPFDKGMGAYLSWRRNLL